jgi:hypothetical protein
VREQVRGLFNRLAAFEREGRTARVGLQTSDDLRFVRVWWEIDRQSAVTDKQRWLPFAKGGAYAPFYADVHLVVNWEVHGEEIKSFVDPKGASAINLNNLGQWCSSILHGRSPG